MLGHELELVEVDGEPLFARQLGGHLDRKAVGRLECERIVAAHGALGRLLEELEPAGERLAELLLGGEHLPDRLALLVELRDAAHLLDDDPGQARQERVEPDVAPADDGAADHAPEDVAAPFVRRRDAVGDEKCHRAAVIGEHAAAPLRGDVVDSLQRVPVSVATQSMTCWKPSVS